MLRVEKGYTGQNLARLHISGKVDRKIPLTHRYCERSLATEARSKVKTIEDVRPIKRCGGRAVWDGMAAAAERGTNSS